MVGLQNQIQIIDVKDGLEMKLPIEAFLEKYGHNLDESNDKYDLFYFNNGKIKIRDLLGWTELNSMVIWKDVSLSTIRFASDNGYSTTITYSKDQIFPVYDKDLSNKTGFHGECVYNYKLKNISQIDIDEYIRIKPITDKNTLAKIEFLKVKHGIFTDNKTLKKAAEINTKSNFCNVNGVYIYASTKISTDLCGDEYKFIPDFIARKRLECISEDIEDRKNMY